MIKADLPTATIDSLMSKLERGEQWDSFKENEQPRTTITSQVDGFDREIRTYNDGSVAISNVEIPKAASAQQSGAEIQGVSRCSADGVWRKGCRAHVNLLVVQMGFYMDYRTDNGGEITNYWGQHHVIVGGAFSNHRFEKFNNRHVRYAADFSVAFKGFPVGWTCWMEAHVSGDKAWTHNN